MTAPTYHKDLWNRHGAEAAERTARAAGFPSAFAMETMIRCANAVRRGARAADFRADLARAYRSVPPRVIDAYIRQVDAHASPEERLHALGRVVGHDVSRSMGLLDSYEREDMAASVGSRLARPEAPERGVAPRHRAEVADRDHRRRTLEALLVGPPSVATLAEARERAAQRIDRNIERGVQLHATEQRSLAEGRREGRYDAQHRRDAVTEALARHENEEHADDLMRVSGEIASLGGDPDNQLVELDRDDD
jgi:hypothetical protein